jgi:hypothetical protein
MLLFLHINAYLFLVELLVEDNLLMIFFINLMEPYLLIKLIGLLKIVLAAHLDQDMDMLWPMSNRL